MNEVMNIYETFDKLRFHHEDEVVEFKKAENNFCMTRRVRYLVRRIRTV